MPTKTALTVARGPSSSTSPRSTSSVITSKPRSTPVPSLHTTTTEPQTSTSSTDTAVIDSVPTSTTIPSSVPMSSAKPSAVESKSESTPTMKPAQIAGLSVAAAATFIVAIGLMVLSVYLRRRREGRAVAEITDEKRSPSSPPRNFSTRFSRPFFSRISSVPKPNDDFARKARPPLARTEASLALAPAPNPISNPRNRQANPNTMVRQGSGMSRNSFVDLSNTHPALRPGAGYTNNSSSSGISSVPTDQIGLAITAELPGASVPVIRLPPPSRKSELREQRVRSLLHPADAHQRPDSVLTQDTVFEEDFPRERRRSSKLLPTPPVPIPPIRTFQPSRPPPSLIPGVRPDRSYPARQQSLQQPGLFLNIPVRYSRSLQSVSTASTGGSSLAPAIKLDPPARSVRTSSVYDQYKSVSTATSTPEPAVSMSDIPDYYFMAHPPKPSISPARITKPKDSPKVVNIKSKPSSSTISRATSRASTNNRDSYSSQTSFETVDPNDPTPEDDDEDKQLEDNKLSPVAESPISNLRYPKVPRASNQLVPRSPRSPASQKSQRSPLLRSPIGGVPEPQSLLAKRRGEQPTLTLDTGSPNPNRDSVRNYMRTFRQHMRSTSVESAWNPTPSSWAHSSVAGSSARHTRTQSSMWPKSPAMYDDAIRPLNIPGKPLTTEMAEVDLNELKSPIWVPRLTPRRQGDDLLISVSYSERSR
ncbi:hypothetical protein BDV96DRAFT_648561 [Lophiotrema nucula]|uniref:Uncharacterized protein n=1 Tax=Lophiotrema nucula TaxID=690887 RepID=A0A6A5Z1N9_9PLEO|nr:hypothetical protein BDV96DRAFT_648561 [Lophiotrema nucula]